MAFSDETLARLEPDVAAIIGRYPRPRSALMPLLHLLQSEEGYVSDDAHRLLRARGSASPRPKSPRWPASTPCTSGSRWASSTSASARTRCAPSWAATRSWPRWKTTSASAPDEPTGDGKVSIEHVECNAACDYAPS